MSDHRVATQEGGGHAAVPPPRPEDFVARTERLDVDPDLLAVAGPDGWLFERDGVGLAGRGGVLGLISGDDGLPPDRVTDFLGRIQVEDEVVLPGTGPVAFAALPFVDGPGEHHVIPRLVVGKAADGTRWITRIARQDHDGADLDLVDPAPATTASAYRVHPTRPPADWCAAVATARDAVRSGELVKVVLAREVLVDADEPIDVVAVLSRLRAAYPSCYLFSMDGLVGASPELLVSRAGDLVRSQPMAGTVRRSGDPSTDARLAAGLLASSKDRVEHQITIDMVHDTLLPFCSYLDAEAEPSVVAVANVAHLATTVHGRLSSPPASALALAAALHPTPAVCGWPRAEAMALIDRLEEMDRGRYAGPVGWVDAKGNGTFAVGIRCAEIDGRRARLFAGVGVVADSDPDAELAETQAKLQALLPAVVRP